MNTFTKDFTKRLIRGLIIGFGILALTIVLPALSGGTSPYVNLPWYLVPVVVIVTLLYGTGWYFAFALIKRAWRKLLRVNKNASIWQAINGRGLVLGIFYGLLCFTAGCLLAFIVGNFFMISDFVLACKGKPPISVKYKFDSDKEYDSWVSTFSAAVRYNDTENIASDKRKFYNEANLKLIENGQSGVVVTERKKSNGDSETVETTVIR